MPTDNEKNTINNRETIEETTKEVLEQAEEQTVIKTKQEETDAQKIFDDSKECACDPEKIDPFQNEQNKTKDVTEETEDDLDPEYKAISWKNRDNCTIDKQEIQEIDLEETPAESGEEFDSNTESENTDTVSCEDGSDDLQFIAPQQRKSRRAKRQYMRSVICGLIIGGISGGMIFGGHAIGNSVYPSNSNTIIPATTTTADGSQSSVQNSTYSSGGMTVSEVANACAPSVVSITNTGVAETINMFGQVAQTQSAGSGVVIGQNDTELLIATNYHVIENSDTLTVCFNDSEDAVYEANVKGTDAENDLAVIAVKISDIDESVLRSIKTATFATSDSANLGDQVVAIGNALGYGQSVTSGYISALDKEVQISETATATLLQTDAAINPGNSGGALFNMKGELIGINTAKYSDTTVEGMGFAIPISKAEPILEKLMTKETKEKLKTGYGYLGISGQDVDTTISEVYDIPTGIYVAMVEPGSCVEKAGLQKGDVITKLNGDTVGSMTELKEMLQYIKAGSTAEITYERNDGGEYKEETVEAVLDSASSFADSKQ